MAAQRLSPVQTSALFDILSHQETYTEIEDFKYPGATSTYGPPFEIKKDQQSAAPILQALLSKFILPLPGLRDVRQDFWQERCQSLIEAFEDAELSESYDKGTTGIRKTLTTAVSALIEYPARGCLGGYPKEEAPSPDRKYDTSKTGDMERAWNDFLQQCTYGSLIEELFAKAAETDQLKNHDPVVQAAHHYVIINLASALHFSLVVHPKGQTILALIERINKLIPYGLVRQTLKVGNVATMISGMTKLFLAKVSLTSFTNWMGLTQAADEGMNLLQQIISTVAGWDIKDLRARAAKIEKDGDAPGKEQLGALREYLTRTREEHEQYREQSRKHSKSMVHVILSQASVSPNLSENQHTQASEYLAIMLSIRDREEIVRVLCHHQPDLLTQLIKDLVAAYEPIIRSVHNAGDLSATVADFESFVQDLIKISRMGDLAKGKLGHGKKENEGQGGTVQDFVQLLFKHQSSSHRFLHEVTKNGPEVSKLWHDYALYAASQFRQSESEESSDSKATDSQDGANSAESMSNSLQQLLSKLSEADRAKTVRQFDAHAKYLGRVHQASSDRLSSVLSDTETSDSTAYAPSMYLVKWQTLLDATPITPATLIGKVRYGSNDIVKDAARIEVDGEKKGRLLPNSGGKDENDAAGLQAPDVSEVVRLLGPGFKQLLARQCKYW